MKLKLISVAALLSISTLSQAAPIQANSATFSGTVIDFNFDDSFLATLPSLEITGPFNLGNGVTLFSSPFVEIGAFNADLGDNGAWSVVGNGNRDGYFLATSFVFNNGLMGFSFANPMQQVGIFANQFQALDTTNNTIQVLAYDANGNVLETFTTNINTEFDSFDEGMFIGFQRASADIYGFGLANGSFVVDNLTISPVPEADSSAMLLAGFGVLGAMMRRRRA
jgi:hypothetical protein